MSEETVAYDAFMDAISTALGKSGGMATGSFVTAAEVLLPSGRHATYLITPPDQPTHRTLGLVRYAEEAYSTEVRVQLAHYFMDDEDEDE
jgi:hypothetical protein